MQRSVAIEGLRAWLAWTVVAAHLSLLSNIVRAIGHWEGSGPIKVLFADIANFKIAHRTPFSDCQPAGQSARTYERALAQQQAKPDFHIRSKCGSNGRRSFPPNGTRATKYRRFGFRRANGRRVWLASPSSDSRARAGRRRLNGPCAVPFVIFCLQSAAVCVRGVCMLGINATLASYKLRSV
jgi:hypothetical protein